MESKQSYIILQSMFNNIAKRYPTTYKKAFQILYQCILNIIRHPNDISYHKIFLTNQQIKNHLLIIPEILDVMENIGFSKIESSSNSYLIYQGKSMDTLDDCILILNKFLSQNQTQMQNHTQKQFQNTFKEPKLRPENNNKQQKYQSFIQNQNVIDNNYNINKSNTKKLNDFKKVNENEKYKVVYFIYDLSEGIAKGLSEIALGKEIEGIWHTSVYVYGREYYYAGGINKGQPRTTKFGRPIKEIDFGFTNKSKNEFEDYLRSISKNFTKNNYDLISHNCNHFSDTALYFLTGNHLPNAILRQHQEILKTPLGRQVRPILESLAGLGNTSNQNNQNNPLIFIPFLFGEILNNSNKHAYKK